MATSEIASGTLFDDSPADDLTEASETSEYPHIPEYIPGESLGNRLVALVRLEQFMNEKTFTPGVIKDLEAIIARAHEDGEPRIATIAELILNQSRKYLQE